MNFEKVCLTEANLDSVPSKKLMSNFTDHIVFFDENLHEIETLLRGKKDQVPRPKEICRLQWGASRD